MNINSFIPYELGLTFTENENFNVSSPYIFVEVNKVKETVIAEFNQTDLDFYTSLLIENGGTKEFDEIFEKEIILTLQVNIENIPGKVLGYAYIYDDIVQWIKQEYGFDLFIEPYDGFVWVLYKHQKGIDTKISSHIKYNEYYTAFCNGIEYFIDNFL